MMEELCEGKGQGGRKGSPVSIQPRERRKRLAGAIDCGTWQLLREHRQGAQRMAAWGEETLAAGWGKRGREANSTQYQHQQQRQRSSRWAAR